jgi:ribosomal protein S16
MAARMLIDAASSARDQQLYDALGFWLLDSVAPNQRREIAKAVQVEWLRLGALVEQRLGSLLERGKAKPLDGCEGRI